jgi:hypothetical protein
MRGIRDAALAIERAKLVTLIASRAPETLDRYADLRSQARTRAGLDLVRHLYKEIAEHEQTTRSRVRKRRARAGVRFMDVVERFAGDLLRARAGTKATGRIYRPTGRSQFSDAPVNYDMFMRALEGLKALGLVEHHKGHTRSQDTGFGFRVTVPGRAARFRATPRLVTLAEEHGITSDNVDDQFFPEPPTNPLVLRDYSTGRGQNKERGRIIKDYERTPKTERLEADIRELNDFLARVKLTGGRHEGYQRTFNNRSWNKGGRLASVGQGNYQQLSEDKRLEMKINGEPVAEIDIRASHLTIYHAMIGEPLEARNDPYARVAGLGIDNRDVAKRWCLETFGNGSPKTKWSSEAIKKFREKGQELPKARVVAKAMLEAFPALKRLEDEPQRDLWADLQFQEAEAILGAMLILKRRLGTPSYSMHDGLLVPRGKWEQAKDVLTKEYRRVVGVEPMLTVDPEPSSFDPLYF